MLRTFLFFGLVIIFSLSVHANVITSTSGLVGYWSADDQTANDSSGLGNHGLLRNGTSFEAGISGQAFRFDGVDDFVEVADNNSLDLVRFTVAAWVNVDQNKNFNGIVNKGFDGLENYELLGRSDGSSHFTVDFLETGRSFPTFGGLVPGEWVHIATSYDGAAMRGYINGIEVLNFARTGTPEVGVGPLHIGNEPGTSRHMDGLIDEVAVFNRALSGSEIESVFNDASLSSAVPEPTTGLLLFLGWFSFFFISKKRITP